MQIYLAYHPDLRALSVTTEDTAKQHYLDKARVDSNSMQFVLSTQPAAATTTSDMLLEASELKQLMHS